MHTIQIIVPPGTAGVEPRLTFNYSSQGTNGLLGIGWTVSGLPVISRCPRTIAQDGIRGGINYDTNDRFCLDGARLMVINGMAYGASGAEYRTEIDSFLKIISYGQAGSGPAYFTVQTKGGELMEFGYTENSRIQAVGKAEARVWALDKISDVKGNYLTVSYFKEVATNGEYHPVQIDYTANQGLSANRHIKFEYNAPYNPRSDQIPQYVGGSKVLTTYLLTNVKTYQGGPDIQSSTLVREYRLTYESGAATGRSRLTSITQCAGDNSCMPSNLFSWQEGILNTYQSATVGQPSGWDRSRVFVGDFNGDGLSDLVSENNGKFYFVFSNGDGTYQLPTPPGMPNGWDPTRVLVGDFNGDGLSDLVSENNGKFYFVLSKGDGTYQLPTPAAQPNGWDPTRVLVGDFNGDGLSDLVSENNGKFYFVLSKGDGTYQLPTPAAQPNGWDPTRISVGDFNGDGISDLLSQNNGKFYFVLSKGDGTYQLPTPAAQPNGWDPTRVFVGDFNGDGISDLVSENNGNFYFAYSKGDGTYQSPAPVGSPSGWDPSVSHVQVADFSGDGIADLVSHNNGNFIWALRSSAFPDLLTHITNSFGGESTVTYKPLTDGSVYVKETNAGYPTVDVQYPLYVVSDITVSPGVGSSYDYNYTYVGAKADAWGRGSLGFHQTLVADPSADSKTTTTNNQEFPKIGKPSAVEVDRLSNGAPFRDTNYDYQTDNAYLSAPTVSFVQPSKIDTVEWEGGQTSSRTISREMFYDSTKNGNLIKVHHYGDVSDHNDDRYEITDWVINTDAWIHRPTRKALHAADQNGGMINPPLREEWLYYDNQAYGATPTFGLLTKEELNGGEAQGSGNNNPVTGRNPVTTYVHESTFGVITEVRDPRGCRITIDYEPTKTYPQTVTNCMSPPQSIGYTYDPKFGVIAGETDPNGQPTAYHHDDFGRLTAVIGPLDSEGAPTIIFDYPDWGDPQNQQVATFRRVEHGGGTVLSSSDFFDGLGRVYQMTREGPNQTTRQSEAAFDSRGLALSATAPHFSGEQAVTTSFIYDPLGRQRRIIYPERPPTIIDYSVPGQVDVTDENGHLKRKFFDAYRRLIEVDEFNNGGTYRTSYEYDAAGSLLTVTNSQGHVTRMVYDKLGRKTIMCDPNMGTPANVTQGDCEAGIAGAWRYTYSPAGDLLTQQDAITTKGVRDQTLTFSYDLLGRPTSKTQGSTTLVSWTYDSPSISPSPQGADYPVGRLTQIDQPQTATTSRKITQFAYDKVGHPLEAKRQLLGAWYTMLQSYDALDRVTSRTFDTQTSNDGERVTYDYNGDWVQSITSSNSTYINDIQYNARGQMAEQNGVPALTYGNNLVSQFSYDPNNFRITAHTTSNNQQNMSYLYDNVGNVTSITDNLFTAGRSFTYDDLNRSITGSGTFGSNQSPQDCTYEYDSIGNMTNKCGAPLEYNYSGHPSAVSKNVATGKTYEYDDNGNMTRRGTQTLTWDVDNRLISIGTTLMEYDSTGQRLIKNAPAGITLFPFDGVEIDPNGVITKYIKIGGEIFAAKKQTNLSFYHNDHVEGVNIITNTNVNNPTCQSNEYDPWGAVSKEEGNCDPTHRFTGEELDPETGIYYYGGRYYDQEIGRFISPDPFVPSPNDPQNLNRYSYALNNPQRYRDPTGYDVGDNSSQYPIGWYGLIRFFIDVFSTDPKPNIIVRPSKAAPDNRRPNDIRNGGLEDLHNVFVYGDQPGKDIPPNDTIGDLPGPLFIVPVGSATTAKNGKLCPSHATLHQRVAAGIQGTLNVALGELKTVGLGALVVGSVAGAPVTVGSSLLVAGAASYGVVSSQGQVISGMGQLSTAFSGNLPAGQQVQQGGDILAGPLLGFSALVATQNPATAQRAANIESFFTAGTGLMNSRTMTEAVQAIVDLSFSAIGLSSDEGCH